jgi:hypothetical protein
VEEEKAGRHSFERSRYQAQGGARGRTCLLGENSNQREFLQVEILPQQVPPREMVAEPAQVHLDRRGLDPLELARIQGLLYQPGSERVASKEKAGEKESCQPPPRRIPGSMTARG